MNHERLLQLMVGIGLFLLVCTEFQAQALKFDSGGKRDPFTSLINEEDSQPAQMVPPPPLEQRPPGLAGLLISEVTVTGMISGSGRQMIILRGIDDMSYFAKAGSKLFDGHLEDVSGSDVVFIREQVDTKGDKKTSKVVKQMQTEDK